MICVRAPWPVPTGFGQRGLRSFHDVVWRAPGAFHLTDGLLGEDRREVEFPRRGDMAGRRESDAVTETERFPEPKRDWLGKICTHTKSV